MNTPQLPPLAKPAFMPINCRNGVIFIGEYYGTEKQGQVVLQALSTYGHLVKCQAVTGTTLRLNFSQFADQIDAANSGSDAARQETVNVLRALHVLNTKKPLPPNSMVMADEEMWGIDANAA